MNNDNPLQKKISRQAFLKFCLSGAAAFAAGGLFSRPVFSAQDTASPRVKKSIKTDKDIVVAQGSDPYRMTRKAIDAIGGMKRFVKKGDIVVVKPNIGWDRTPEQAGNTNPFVVAALVELAFEAGAKRVNVFDVTCNSPQRCYENSGIKAAAEAKGAKVYFPDDWNFVKAKFSYASPMEGWPIFRDALDCDVFINVPVLKNHGLTGLTLSMKNLMGVCGGNRGQMHTGIGEKLADLTDYIRPELTVIDAYRVLTANGPSGGSLGDVRLAGKVIVSTDPVLADSFACREMGVDPQSISYIAAALKKGLGKHEVSGERVLAVTA